VPLFDETAVRTILLDIEGTTTPVDFVTTTLFPYASRKLEAFLYENFRIPEIRALLEDLRAEHQRDEQSGLQPPQWQDGSEHEQLRSSAVYGQWLIAKDSKCTPLKTLQGKIWQHGYARGELKGEVYPDVPPAFARWKRQGRKIYIYSSGSVLAQMLLFGSVRTGDLIPYIASFFDTHVGAKAETESYRRIAASTGCEPTQFLFLSDAGKEIAAARAAGMQALLCRREETACAAESAVHAVQHFNDIFP
jgi:enolase-phosphatase E1